MKTTFFPTVLSFGCRSVVARVVIKIEKKQNRERGMSVVPSYHDEVTPANYEAALAVKVAALREQFAPLLLDGVDVKVFPSPPSHFRSRCRFQVVSEVAEEEEEEAADEAATAGEGAGK